MKRFLSDSFFSDVVRLILGTAGGRIILLATLPIATRIYSPTDFALLAVYMALINTIAVVSCLRLELAIPLAKDDSDAANLLALSLAAVGAIAIALFLVALIGAEGVAALIGTPEIAPFLWLVPIGVALAGSYSALQFWATRLRRFTTIARTRVGQAATGSATMLALGFLGISPLGLLLGNTMTVGAGGGALMFSAIRNDLTRLRTVSATSMRDVLRRFKRYPLFSSPEALANIAGIQWPILVIAALRQDDAGQLFLAMQIMVAPMALLGTSVAQVYASRAAEEYAANNLGQFTFDLLRRLFFIGPLPLAMLGLIAPFVMPIVFGAEWETAGQMMALMVPWMVLQFLASPISIVMMTTDRQPQMLLLTTFGGIVRISAVFAAFYWGAQNLALAYFAASALFYLVCLVVFSHAAGVTRIMAVKKFATGLIFGLIAYGVAISQIAVLDL